jgi:hypothetical protein
MYGIANKLLMNLYQHSYIKEEILFMAEQATIKMIHVYIMGSVNIEILHLLTFFSVLIAGIRSLAE